MALTFFQWRIFFLTKIHSFVARFRIVRHQMEDKNNFQRDQKTSEPFKGDKVNMRKEYEKKKE